MGQRKRLNAEIRISHYSNGNLFPRNAGVTVPITVIVGRFFLTCRYAANLPLRRRKES